MSATQRRALLIARHHLAGRADDAETAVASLLAVHSSDPATPHLSVWARTYGQHPDATFSDDGWPTLNDALHHDRTVWRVHAMRRTLFVIASSDAPVVHAAATRDLAIRERQRLHEMLDHLATETGDELFAQLRATTDKVLAEAGPLATAKVAELVPPLAERVTVGSGKWTTQRALASNFLMALALDGSITRAAPVGTWRSSQYQWARTQDWFVDNGFNVGKPDPKAGVDHCRAGLVRRYLATCGPATIADISWWTGWSKRAVLDALSALETVEVTLPADDASPSEGRDLPVNRGAEVGLLLAHDPIVAGLTTVLERTSEKARFPSASAPPGGVPVVALLPALDSTPMSYRQRDWYLPFDATSLFDRNGNIGPTVWVDGRIVGGWAQVADGSVVTKTVIDVSRQAETLIEAHADRLTAALSGTVVIPRFRTPLERKLSSSD